MFSNGLLSGIIGLLLYPIGYPIFFDLAAAKSAPDMAMTEQSAVIPVETPPSGIRIQETPEDTENMTETTDTALSAIYLTRTTPDGILFPTQEVYRNQTDVPSDDTVTAAVTSEPLPPEEPADSPLPSEPATDTPAEMSPTPPPGPPDMPVPSGTVSPVRVSPETPAAAATLSPTVKPSATPTPHPTALPSVTRSPSLTPTRKPTAVPKPTAAAPAAMDSVQTALLNAVNAYRKNLGLSAVQADSRSCSFAMTRAKEIAADFSHAGFDSRISNHTLPYPSYTLVSENLAMNSNPDNVVSQWANSAPHAANMQRDTPYVCVGHSGNYYAYEGWKP